MGLGAQDSGRCAHDPGRGPGRVVEAGAVPARSLAARVVGLAQVVAVVAGGARHADLPRAVGGDDLLGAVRVGDVEVEPQPRSGTPLRLLPAPVPGLRGVVVVAGAELGSDHVLARVEEGGDVVGGVENRAAVVGEPGIQHARGNGLTVDRKIVVGEARCIHPSPGEGLGDPERLAQPRRGPDLAALALVVLEARRGEASGEPEDRAAELTSRSDRRVVGLAFGRGLQRRAFRAGDPLAFPLAAGQERGLEPGGRRPLASQSSLGRNTDRPVVAGARSQGRACVEDPGVGGHHVFGVPDVRLPLSRELRLRGHEAPKGTLPDAAFRAGHGPTKPRRQVGDAQRLGRGVRLQARESDPGRGRRSVSLSEDECRECQEHARARHPSPTP